MADDGATGVPSNCLAHHCRETKRGRYSSKDLDSISSLPDVILQHILSFLLTKLAIRTSILSKRWRHVWCGTPSISLPDSYRQKADLINKTLACYTARKIRKFHFDTSTPEHLPYIDKWIEFAMSRNVENLSLRVRRYNIPEFFYTNSSVIKLRVHLLFCDMMIPKCSVSWTCLKKLHLQRAGLCDESVAKILSGCPILQCLKLYYCTGVMVLDLGKSPRMKILEIKRNICVPGPRLILAPHIHRLVLTNSQLPCTLVDVSSLKEAELDIFVPSVAKMKADFLKTMVLDMLEKLQNVEKLTLGETFLRILSLVEHRCVQFPSFTVKALTLETTISQYVIPGIVRLLQNSPRLNKLTLEYTKNPDSIEDRDIDQYLDPLYGYDSAQFWNSEARFFKDCYPYWDVKPKHVASFIELMLKSTNTLEKMVVSMNDHLKQGGLEELLEMVPSFEDTNVFIVLMSLTHPRGFSHVTN